MIGHFIWLSNYYCLNILTWIRVISIFKFIPGATLTFEVELINIGDTVQTTNVFKEIDTDADKMLSREEVRYLLLNLLKELNLCPRG